MKLTRFVSLFTLSFFCLAGSSDAKEWRGLVPLHSSRTDVERLLGAPNSSGKYISSYHLEDEIVTFLYAGGGPCGNDATNSWKVPQGTIVDITVAPKQKLVFSTLNISQKNYEEAEDQTTVGLFYYTNKEEGIRYSVQRTIEVPEGIVINIDYWPAEKDNYLRCPTQRGGSNKTHYAPFEDYGNIAFNDEKPRLDNFAIHLQRDPELIGYILVYAVRSARPEAAQKRANRAKQYLVDVRGVESSQIVTLDGGYREALTTELYLLRRDLPPPAAKSTEDTSREQTIKAGRSRKSLHRSPRPLCKHDRN